jgi:uncharacterized protein YndB with AHSA1/START domain
MTSTTSHGSPGSGAAVPPLRREVIVDAGRDLAFAVFTERIGAWWPLGRHSVYGDRAAVTFDGARVGARIVESAAGVDDAVWGTVTAWRPGELVAFTWHPGMTPETASKVAVTFEDVDGKTLVTLEHTGWEIFGDRAAEERASYAGGWTTVLDRYVVAVGAA